MLNGSWVHAGAGRPCPICRQERRKGRPVRCIFVPGRVALCYYTPGEHARQTTAGEAWLHFLQERERAPRRRWKTITPTVRRKSGPRRYDLSALARKFQSRITRGHLQSLSHELGVSIESLERLEVGWSGGEPMFVENRGGEVAQYAWSFPRRSANGDVIGICMRPKWGRKYGWTGSGGGLHIPSGFIPQARTFLCEGPSDMAAALDLGLNGFGRSSCGSDVDDVLRFLRRQEVQDLVIFSQRDEAHYRSNGDVYYPAQDGAAALAKKAIGHVRDIRIILPPFHFGDKDVRDWKRRGGTADDVQRLVMEARPARQPIVVCQRNRKGNGVCHTTTIS